MAVPLDAALDRLARELSGGDVECRGVLPLCDGRLVLGVAGAAGVARRLVLDVRPVGARSRRVSDLWLDFAAGEVRDERALDSVAARLVRAVDGGPAEWLRRRNRERSSVDPAATALLALLSGLIEPGAPFWHGWTIVAAAERVGPTLAIELQLASNGGAGPGRKTLRIDACGDCPAGLEPVTSTPLGRLLRPCAPADERSELQPERAIALALRLSVHAGMRWSEAAAGGTAHRAGTGGEGAARGAAGGLGANDTLVDHCFRSARAWNMRASRFFGTWGDKDFFELLSLVGDEDVAWVFHAGRECQMAIGPLSASLDQGPNPYFRGSNAMRGVVGGARLTDLDEVSVIGGGEARLAAALEQPWRGRLRVHLGCDYHVIGDDVSGVCRCAREGGADVELLNPPLPRFTDASGGQWWRRLLQPEAVSATPRSPATVNLAGLCWPAAPARDELAALLSASGIRVASVFFPGRDAAFAGHGRAALTVASPWAPVQATVAAVMSERSYPLLSPPAPYGEAATLAWLAAISDALGRAAPSPAEWRARVETLAPALSTLREAARGFRLGLLADFGTALELCSPAFFFGLDPLACFLDLGFEVHVVAARASSLEARRAAFPADWRDRLHLHDVDAGADPLAHVGRLALRLVYCDAHTSLPVKRQGAHPFSIRDLEPGVAGAARGLRRLLSRAGSSLYAEFGQHLGTSA